MAKKSDIILWVIGIIILLVVLNYFGIIDFSQIFSTTAGEQVGSVIPAGSGGPGSVGVRS